MKTLILLLLSFNAMAYDDVECRANKLKYINFDLTIPYTELTEDQKDTFAIIYVQCKKFGNDVTIGIDRVVKV